MKKILIVLLIINLAYSAYQFGIYAYNAHTSTFDVAYFQKLVSSKQNIKDVKTLEDWKCRHEIYIENRNEWLTALIIGSLILVLAILPPKRVLQS